jgi:serine/threonine-protein kinase
VDTTLDREVAIKVLPDTVAADPERLARFAREARLLASLNHPNVAAIYGIHEVPEPDSSSRTCATHFLAMELIDGEDLQQRMTRGALPIEEALRVALEIAQGFEAAHARGIVHRDLKPANVRLSLDGGVKVLDFGLAKALAPDVAADSAAPSMSPTMTSTGTVAGMILGTASYMSPEQAKGKPVDRRADIWSFGVVLFEILSGRRLFEGGSVSETLAAVLMKDPDWSALPANIPAKASRLLRRCLTRDPKSRLQDIGEARIALQEMLAGDMNALEVDRVGPSSSWSRKALPWLGLGALLGLAVGWAALTLRGSPQPETGTIIRFAVQAPEGLEKVMNPTPAPDDSYVVYRGMADGVNRLYLHDFESGETRPLAAADGGDHPFLSPDGRWVGFTRSGDLMKLRLAGGDAVKIGEAEFDSPGASWGPDGTILYPPGWLQGLWRIPVDGGKPVPVTTVNVDAGEKGHWWPRFLPDGRHALFTIWNAGAGLIDADVALLDIETGTYRKLVRGADAWFLPPGHIVYFHAGSYHAIAFDPDTLAITGDPVPILGDATEPSPQGTQEIGLSISRQGTLFYTEHQINPPVRLALVAPAAAPEVLPFPARAILSLALSPDGRTVAASSVESGLYVTHLMDLQSGTEQRLDLSGSSWNASWKPDGSGFAFQSMTKGDFDIYFKDVKLGGPDQPLLDTPTDEELHGWSVDGRHVIVEVTLADGGRVLKTVPVGGTGEDMLITETNVTTAVMSPDGDWLAYVSRQRGENNVYVKPYPGPGVELRVSPGGGQQAAWSPDGDELYYLRDTFIVAVPYDVKDGRFRPGKEEVVFESPLLTQTLWAPLVVLDRRRFLVTLLEEESGRPRMNVVLNWSREAVARLKEQ